MRCIFQLGILIVVTGWLTLGFAESTTTAAKEASKVDVRVVIDVSGSMKKNDPNNLRIPATKLILNLLPQNSRAGVWLFGNGTRNIIPVAEVSPEWLAQADKQVHEIHSRSPYTDIGSGLDDATEDWKTADPSTERIVIILTDGWVDIDKDPKANGEAKEKIVKTMIPQLRKRGIKIYTVALSENADHKLMQQISEKTQGFYKKVARADELQRSFFKIFEAAIPRDTVPIRDNYFIIDKSASEFTLMVFPKETAVPLQLISPSGKIFSQQHIPEGVKWHKEIGYYLVTMRRPEPGRWQLNLQVDQDSRVFVVSDLNLQISQVPSVLFLFEDFDYRAQINENGKKIQEKAFLNILNFNLTQLDKDGKQIGSAIPLKNNGEGTFHAALNYNSKTIGPQELILRVSGKTFHRINRQMIKVHKSPVILRNEKSEKTGQYLVYVMPDEDLVDPNTLKVTVMIYSSAGQAEQYQVTLQENNRWVVKLAPNKKPAEYTSLIFDVKGRTVNGRDFQVRMAPYRISLSGATKVKSQAKLIPIAFNKAEPKVVGIRIKPEAFIEKMPDFVVVAEEEPGPEELVVAPAVEELQLAEPAEASDETTEPLIETMSIGFLGLGFALAMILFILITIIGWLLFKISANKQLAKCKERVAA